MVQRKRALRECDKDPGEISGDREGDPGTVRNKTKECRGIKPDIWQKEILETEGNILLCTGRQVGKTTTFAKKAAERLISQKGARIIVASLTEDQAQLIIIMVLTHLEQNYKWEIARGKKAPTKNKIYLKNGSMILARPVGNTGDAIRGFTGDVLIIDEASRMPEDMWLAAKPTLLTTAGDIWICSTPFGKEGYFYEAYQNKNNRFKVFHVSSEEVIENREISETWTIEQRESALRFLDDEKRDMSELQYAQEYLGKFIDDLRRFFSDEIIKKSCILEKRDHIFKGATYFLGCDIARLGEDEGTYEIIHRISKDNLEHVESLITRKQLTTATYDKILGLNKLYNFKQIGIDAGSGSLGVGILDFLLRSEVKRKVIALNNLQRQLDHTGERKRTLLKEDMYFNLLALMEKKKIKLLDDENVKLSLRSIQYEYVLKPGQPTKLRIFGNYSHIVEGLVRAAWLANQKHINMFIDYI